MRHCAVSVTSSERAELTAVELPAALGPQEVRGPTIRTVIVLGNFAVAMRWLQEGRIPVQGLVERVSPADAQAVYQDLLHRRARRLFVEFDWAQAAGLASSPLPAETRKTR